MIAAKRGEMDVAPGFAEVYLPGGQVPSVGQRLTQPRLAETFRRLARDGLDSFYRGDLARTVAADLERIGSPIDGNDLARHQALDVTPLSLDVAGHEVFNMPPPTQGLAALILLRIVKRCQFIAYGTGVVDVINDPVGRKHQENQQQGEGNNGEGRVSRSLV